MNRNPPEPRPPFLADQRLSLLTDTGDVLRHLDVEAFRPHRDRGGFRGGEQGKNSPWQPLERDEWLDGLRCDGPFRRCVVEADAGLGKSTNLAWLNAALAQHQPHLLAFYLPIELLPASTADLFDVLLDRCWREAEGCGDQGTLTGFAAKNLLKRYQRTGRLVLLLDSLDQTPDNGPAEQTLQKLLTRSEWAGCPIVFSTRPHALSTRWHRLFKGHHADWRFVRIEQLDEDQQRRLLGEIVDAEGNKSRFDLIPGEARGILGVPRVCEIFRRLNQRDHFKELKTLADITWKATTEMLQEGLKACEAGDRLGWDPNRGKVPSAYRPVQRHIAFHILAALAFQMFVNPNEQNEPGAAPNLAYVPETESERLLLGVLDRLMETNARLQAEKRFAEAKLLGSLDLADFFSNFAAICAMNAGPLENYLLDHMGRHKELRWRNPTLQAFFAAAWACRFASSEDLALLRNWIVDPWDEKTQVYVEFWRFASEMKDGAVHRQTWVALMSPLYDGSVRDPKGHPVRSSEFIYRSWDRMERWNAEFLRKYQEEFEQIRTGQKVEAKEVAEKMLDGFILLVGSGKSGDNGSFDMGAPLDEYPEWDTPHGEQDNPRHSVTLSRFCLHCFCVTNREYELFDPRHRSHRWEGGQHPSVEETRDSSADDCCPVVMVSWYDAWCFARWLGTVLVAGTSCRPALPTEAQWEYACRAGRTTPFTFHEGHDGRTCTADVCNFDGNYPFPAGVECPGEVNVEACRKRTLPVDGLRRNPWGLSQMHGNVWEWCADWYEAEFYGTGKGKRSDPLNDEAGASTRVLRGGSWSADGWFCRSASRDGLAPVARSPHVGFRLAALL